MFVFDCDQVWAESFIKIFKLLINIILLQYFLLYQKFQKSHISCHDFWHDFDHDQNWVHVHIHMLFMINNVSYSFCLCESCVYDLFHELCIRKQSSILFFYSFNQNKLQRMILMKFFYQNQCIFLYYCVQFSCFLFIFFSFDQELKLCEFHVSFHVINQVNKIWVFFIFNTYKLWWWHLSVNQIIL